MRMISFTEGSVCTREHSRCFLTMTPGLAITMSILHLRKQMRGQVTCPRPHTWEVTEQVFPSRPSDCREFTGYYYTNQREHKTQHCIKRDSAIVIGNCEHPLSERLMATASYHQEVYTGPKGPIFLMKLAEEKKTPPNNLCTHHELSLIWFSFALPMPRHWTTQ